MRLETETMAFARSALGVEMQQFGGGIAHLFGRFFLGLFPLAGAQRMQLNRFRIDAAIARNDLQLRHRHIELGPGRIFEMQELGIPLAEVHMHQALIAADAMVFMHHRIANLQLGKVTQPAFEIGPARLGAPSAWPGGRRVKLILGDDRDAVVGQGKATRKGAGAQGQALAARGECSEIGAGGGR